MKTLATNVVSTWVRNPRSISIGQRIYVATDFMTHSPNLRPCNIANLLLSELIFRMHLLTPT